ncbi:MAG TPA: hypothetical protein VGI63_09645 [Verrucomicrobiae bacterium]|jgi:hypothetical protein
MEKKKPKMPDEGLGKFCIIAGCAMAILPFLLSQPSFSQKCSAAASGCFGLSWGLKEVAAAKKWKKKYGEPNLEEQMEIKKSHSISNLLLLLMLLVLGIAALALLAIVILSVIPHYEGVKLIHHER